MAVVEFRKAWNRGRFLVLNPTLILDWGTSRIKATARGMAIDTITMGTVRFFSFIDSWDWLPPAVFGVACLKNKRLSPCRPAPGGIPEAGVLIPAGPTGCFYPFPA